LIKKQKLQAYGKKFISQIVFASFESSSLEEFISSVLKKFDLTITLKANCPFNLQYTSFKTYYIQG